MGKPLWRSQEADMGAVYLACRSMVTVIKAKNMSLLFSEPVMWKNRMREIRSYGSVGERGGNELLYPESWRFEVGGLMEVGRRKFEVGV